MSDRQSVDDYLAALPEDTRHCLEDLRTTLRDLLPGAEETLSYGMPAFRLGRVVAGYGAFKSHCGLYPHSGTVLSRLAGEIAAGGFEHSKGAVTFRPDRPLPGALVSRIVSLRLEEIGG